MEEGKILMIPGPTYVRPDVREACASPPWGHRDREETERRLIPIRENLAQLMEVDDSYEIFVFSSSGTGAMEAAIRNCAHNGPVLNVSCGAFGDLFHEITSQNGKQGTLERFEDGKAVNPDKLFELLKERPYEAVTLTHNETSTGVMNDLEELSVVMGYYPGVLWIVDAVSSFGGVRIPIQDLGIDVLVASSQKCLALPPGLAVAAVSKRAMEKAATVENRGYYFDFLEFQKSNEKYQTPTTPNAPLIDALDLQLDYIVNDEGIEKRFARHQRLAAMVQEWAEELDFRLFAEQGYRSPTVTCIRNPQWLDKKSLKAKMRDKGYLMDTGYRGLEKKDIHTFRVPTMGDITEDMLRNYLGGLDFFIEQQMREQVESNFW